VGFLTIAVLVFSSIGIVISSAIIMWAASGLRQADALFERERAFYLAEAGIEYYRWHLAHAPVDFTDGQGATSTGPYVHNQYDGYGNIIGTFKLTVTPPIVGSTVVTVKSTGSIVGSSVVRTIEAKLAIPSLSKYSFVANDKMRFGEGTEIFGPVHSNGGIRLDGLAHNVVSSAVSSYDDADHGGINEFGVHTHVKPPPLTGSYDDSDGVVTGEAPPTSVAARTDVFEAGRQFPVPAIDFAGFSSDLASLKTKAVANGRYFFPSGKLGFKIVLKTNDTFDVYRVEGLVPAPSGCSNTGSQVDWGTWSIDAARLVFQGTFTNPANGIIFVEDDLWVEGKINTARITIAAAGVPENVGDLRHITVNSNVLYTNYDGQDVLALIAQGNVIVGLKSLNTQRIDATLLAKSGKVGRYSYVANCGAEYVRSTITVYGSICSNQRYGFAYTNGTGYTNRTVIYDANLLYNPPPDFPLAADSYNVISWREL
jgi:hypothetical protein